MNKKPTKKLLKRVNRQMQWKNVCPVSIVSSYKSIESFAILQLQFTSLLSFGWVLCYHGGDIGCGFWR